MEPIREDGMSRFEPVQPWLKRLVLGLMMVPLVWPLRLMGEPTETDRPPYQVTPIGWVRVVDGQPHLDIDPRYQPALLGLESGARIWVLYWLDRNDAPEPRSRLQVHPRGNPANPLQGVLATRAPLRPNPIGLSQCRILAIEGASITVDRLDAWSETPILDIKPVLADE
jgi:tRNA (adenine37-N6)-methyltransferase